MSKTQNTRIALISGANRGIGAAIACHLRANGYGVSLGARDVSMLEKVHGKQDSTMHFGRFDAYDKVSAKEWVESAVNHFGRIDALVNNAGNGNRLSLLDDDEDALDELLEVNVKAPLRMTRLCLPHLAKTGHGRIINIVSLSGKRVRNEFVGYNMSKFAAMGLTHTTRHVTWEQGIRATAICPGFVRSDMSSYTAKVSPEDMTQPETIAHLVRTAIELPNNAAMAEMLVNCRLEDML
ncbi:NADP-dependent 3-hydroxy acid dehydrogenase YdfG [Cohaesibacter marisflavi]|uniref:NADP-dependent 3-hydroxy acid dehydrogenase YdfG n=2 Tax=Cohaesibacter marisflavi TaxID=655353 RepID=A0A1I5L8D2_9HYPH|nr:SDR family NAD(P)-dependent oxidoreductase [Cohaesibacter marisflavi]SFO93442.1 NADP-dependent 3-hydroxy acid dehydrogenase YdfG [Cohaesibacter marisflavi]